MGRMGMGVLVVAFAVSLYAILLLIWLAEQGRRPGQSPRRSPRRSSKKGARSDSGGEALEQPAANEERSPGP